MLATLLLYFQNEKNEVWNTGRAVSSESPSHIENYAKWILFLSNHTASELTKNVYCSIWGEEKVHSLLSILKFLANAIIPIFPLMFGTISHKWTFFGCNTTCLFVFSIHWTFFELAQPQMWQKRNALCETGNQLRSHDSSSSYTRKRWLFWLPNNLEVVRAQSLSY